MNDAVAPSLVVLLLLVCSVVTDSANISQQNVKTQYRLPTNLRPEYYRLELITNLADINDNFTFQGHVQIKMICDEDTNKIVLHSKKLEIDEAEVKLKHLDSNGQSTEITTPSGKCVKLRQNKDLENCIDGYESEEKPITIIKHSYREQPEFYIIETEQVLKAGQKYSLLIPYKGQLTEGLAGYYRSSYKDLKTDEIKWLAVTQFESTDARMALPCFDEPSFKAKFQVNLGRINHRTTISNMPLVSSEPISKMEGWTWDRYELSVPMSTYLLAFMVSDFDFKVSEKSRNNDVVFRIWARKDAIGQVDYAAIVGPKVLEYYEEYFDEKYPLPKQDMVAIPDFSAGAMENWGLITYRETALLYDKQKSSAASQPYVASVIAHELAHQWFGNLVTMKWWTDLWLNEGFATYVASLGVHHVHPEWNSLDEEAADNMLSVFGLDSLKSSHPISVPIGHPSEISQIFDKISYDKGSLVLRMMNMFLGEDTFRDGVRNYLKENKYGNAEQDDLWESMTRSAHKHGVLPKEMNVKEIMDTWTLQTGYPVVTVMRDYEKGTASLRQKRFLSDRIDIGRAEESCWWIPLSYTCPSEANFNRTSPKQWMKCGEDSQVDGLPNDQWVVFNIKMSAIYKVLYDDKNWEMLISTLNSDHYDDIHVLNRVQLIVDAADFARTGELDYEVSLKLMNYLERETDLLPWDAALTKLSFLDYMLRYTESYGLFRKYMKKVLTPIYEKIGHIEYEVSGENLQKIRLQTLVIRKACRFNIGDCKQKAIDNFKNWMEEDDPDQNNPIPKDLRSLTYCTAIKHGGEEEWDFAWQRYLKSNVGTEKSMILSTLGCTRDVWLLNRYLKWSINSNSSIRRQDSTSVFSTVAYNDIGYILARSFFFERKDDIFKYHGPKTSVMGRYAKILSGQIVSDNSYKEFQHFVKDNESKFKDSSKAVEQGLESARVNVQWHDKHLENLTKILQNIVNKK